MDFLGYVDALSKSGETLQLAMELLLPFYSVTADTAWLFIPWFTLFATAWATFKLFGQQAKGADLLRPISIFIAIAICMYPLSPKVTEFDRPFGLGPYAVYSVSKSFNDLVTEGINYAQSEMMGGQPVPLTALSTMNQEYSNIFKGSELAPLLNDYWGNCTVGVVDFEEFSPKHWQSVGLLGPGVLGLQPADIENSKEYLRSLTDPDRPKKPTYRDWQPNSGILKDVPWDRYRKEVKPILEARGFPNGTGRSYRIPTAGAWRSDLGLITQDGGAPESRYLSLDEYDIQDKARYMRPEVYDRVFVQGDTNYQGYDSTRFYAKNCFTLYLLAHRGLNEYYKAIREAYAVPDYQNATGNRFSFEGFNAATSRAAYTGGLQTYYAGSYAKRLNDVSQGAAMNGLSPQGDTYRELSDAALTETQGWLQAITSFFLELNLDQWVLTLIGSLGLAMAFLLVLFPFFVPFAFFSSAGENTITVLFKVIIMLQLTLTLSFVIASIGASIMAVVNAYAATSYSNSGLSTMSIGGLAVAINTGCLVFPLFAARLAYLALFGSMGANPASGQTISAGQMAMTSIIAGAIGSRILGKATSPIRKEIQHNRQVKKTQHAASQAATSTLKSSGLQNQVNRIEQSLKDSSTQATKRGATLKTNLASPQQRRPDISGRFTTNTQSSASSVSAEAFRKGANKDG